MRRELIEGWFGWIGYTLTTSDRTDAPGGPARRFDFDQTHNLTVVLSYALEDWTFGTRFRYATGAPRTPVTGALYDATNDRFQPILGDLNSDRLTDFLQWDLRIERTFLWDAVDMAVYLDVLNVTNHENAEEAVYSVDFQQRRFITGLPLWAVAGVKVTF